jgi:hypothetical protein
MVQPLCEVIVVRGSEFVSVRLTPEAYAHGLALVLPQEVVVVRSHAHARTAAEKLGIGAPTGVKRADAINIRIPIVGTDLDIVAEGA